ncbi:hypothetical protein MNBD_NITROSPINAE05-1276, partial [hydrothermal vent metagenome]
MEILRRIAVIICIVSLYHPGQGDAQEAEERMFRPSQMISFELSKAELKNIYWQDDQKRTFHCGCLFDKIQQLAPQVCLHGTQAGIRVEERKFLGWIHAVPVAVFAKPLKCWNEALCRKGRIQKKNGARCCNVLSQKFKKREADMHNLFPAVALEDEETDGPLLPFGGMEEYRYCSADGKPVLNPRPGVQGDIARAYFYMSRLYKLPIPDDLED